jgi:disulfide bond formation protein DsbB
MRQSLREDRALRVFSVSLLVSAAVLGAAYYLQHVERLDPCPWCIVQRLGFLALGLLALIGLLWRGGPVLIRAQALLGALLGVLGAAAAGYQVWLQSDPERAGACVGSPVERMLDTLALGDLWPGFLQYDGPCDSQPWTLFGLSIPEWSLAWFVVLAALHASLLARPRY